MLEFNVSFTSEVVDFDAALALLRFGLDDLLDIIVTSLASNA
jgi:hypothetical protein